MIVFSDEQCFRELETIILDKFRGLHARELSIKQLEELLELRKILSKVGQRIQFKERLKKA